MWPGVLFIEPIDADMGVPRSVAPPFARGRLLGVAYLSILGHIISMLFSPDLENKW